MIPILIDILLGYFGITSLTIFSFLFIKKDYLDIIILGLIMDLYYPKYYCLYLIISFLIIIQVNKIIGKNIFLNIVMLYLITNIYYLITIPKFNKLIFLYSILPCIFYILHHIMKYEKNKQNINSCNNNTIYFNRFKSKQKI